MSKHEEHLKKFGMFIQGILILLFFLKKKIENKKVMNVSNWINKDPLALVVNLENVINFPLINHKLQIFLLNKFILIYEARHLLLLHKSFNTI